MYPQNENINTFSNQAFNNKSFNEKLADTGILLRSTFKLFWLGGSELRKPLVKACIFATVKTCVFFGAILSLVFASASTIIILPLLVLLWLCMTLYSKFLYTRVKADQSLLVYKAITGKNLDYSGAHLENNEEKGKIRSVALIDLFLSNKGSINNGDGSHGKFAILFNIFFAALAEVWDLLSNYLLPAVVIEKKNWREIAPNLKKLKDNIPATLAGVFGIDFVGSVLGTLVFGVYFVGVIIALIVGYLLSFIITSGTIVFGDVASSSFGVNLYPLLATIFLIAVISAIYSRIIDSIKSIYYSCFYTSLTRQEEILPGYRLQILDYLNFKSNSSNNIN